MIRHRAFLSSLVTATSLACASVPAWADSDGLPQLDTSLFFEQLFWLAISFVVLYALMAYVALPSVKRTQDRRMATIGAELAAAQAANESAKATMADYEKALTMARAQAHATVNEIAAQAAKESAIKQAAQQQQLAKRLQEAEAKIAATRDAAVRDVKSSVADLALAIVARVTAFGSDRHHA
jgi:F-type H+-transporting ATPase subunit b